MKRTIALIMTAAIFVAFLAPVQANAKSTPTTVDFEEMTNLVTAGNPGYRRERNEIRALEINLNEMNRQYNSMFDQQSALEQQLAIPGVADTPDGAQIAATIAQLNVSASELDKNINTLRNRLNEMRSSLASMAKRHTLPAQRMYISHYILLIDHEVAGREMLMLERELDNCKQRQARGLSTQNDVRNAERGVDNQQTLLKARQDAIDNNLDTLARYLNLSAPIRLAGLPKLDFDQITKRNYPEDMRAYIAAASAPAERVYKDAMEAVRNNNTPANQHSADVAAQDLAKAKKDAEEDFPKAYKILIEAYDDYANSKTAADAQLDYDNAASRYARGLISKSALLQSELMLENTQARYEQQRIQLWVQLLEYELALVH